MGKRRKGREILLQSMYASLISGADLLATLDDQLSRRESAPETTEFSRQLAIKVKTNSADLDRWLRTLISSNWDPERLGSLELCILTLGLAEIKHSPDVPYRAAINEALELTRRYCDEPAVSFINGILDAAARQVYPDGVPAADANQDKEST